MRSSHLRRIRAPIGVFAALLVLGVSSSRRTAAAEEVDAWAIPSEATRGEFTYTNRLIDSNDPYLLLHAHNPVDWHPWGPEAFATAKRENKPIFLSIGYSTCYWCHVAEKTIYSNPDIASLMNEWFVNVKVDREQRPDIDQVYMLATQLLTGRGGWPNNLFLTPELKPFFAGSYFPPEDDSYGRVGFPTILEALHGAWTSERERVAALADAVHAAMESAQPRLAEAATAPLEPAAWMAKAKEALLPSFDPQYGGYRSETSSPKFPSEPVLDLLLTDYRLNRDPQALDRLLGTLNAMAYGGIWDHLGKGFYRYSTDRTWSIPHFEKMLYDNAQLLIIYAEAYRETSLLLYRRVAIGVADYLSEQMMAPQGGFYTAQDSQVKGREGASYLWTRDEIERVLGPLDARRFFQVYALTLLPEPPVDTPAAEGAGDKAEGSVLRVRLPIDETLKRTESRDVVEMLSALEPLRQKLFAVREERLQPARDDKIIVELNGIAIAGFAIGGQILERPEYIGLARRAAERIWNLAYDPKTGRLMHEIFQGRAQTEGYLADYAHLGEGFMALHEVTGESVWRRRAVMLADAILERFAREDGALAIAPADEALLILPEDFGDDVYPSGTSATIDLLLRLSATGADPQYEGAAARVIRHSSTRFARHPEAWASAIVALNENALESRGWQEGAAEETAAAAGEQRGSGFHVPDSADHVHAAAVANRATDRDEIVVTLRVEEGYHINANPASLDFLIPTSVSFDSLTPAEIRYPEPVRFKPAFAAEALDVYEGSTAIVAIFPKQTLEGVKTVNATVTIQACDAEVCLLPATLPLAVRGPSGE